MSEYSERFASTALRMLSQKGVVCTLKRKVHAPMNAAGDRVDQPSSSAAVGVEFPSSLSGGAEGTKVKVAKVLMSAVDPYPEVDDLVNINGRDLLIRNAKNLAPDGVLIYSELEVAV